MKKIYYSPAMEETMCQGLKIMVDSTTGGQPGGDGGNDNPFGSGAPRRL